MATMKSNDYLDIENSDSDTAASDDSHQHAIESRTAHHAPPRQKKRKLSHTSDSDDENSSGDEEDEQIQSSISNFPPPLTTKPEASPPIDLQSPNPPPQAKTSKKHHKPGIIYLSRIPPHMRPSALRHLLSTHGPITNLFLTPAPPSTRTNPATKSTRKSYTDGWIEFARRSHARACQAAINARPIGKKGGYYRDDLLNAKFLKGFSWGDLMGGVRAEEREREERVRVGVARERREREGFLRGVREGKVGVRREGKRRRRGGEEEREAKGEGVKVGGESKGEGAKVGGEGKGKGERGGVVFRQSGVVEGRRGGGDDEVRRVLGKIF